MPSTAVFLYAIGINLFLVFTIFMLMKKKYIPLIIVETVLIVLLAFWASCLAFSGSVQPDAQLIQCESAIHSAAVLLESNRKDVVVEGFRKFDNTASELTIDERIESLAVFLQNAVETQKTE